MNSLTAEQNGREPAAPVPETEYPTGPSPAIYQGLTKREEFAKAAMQGLLGSMQLSEAQNIIWQEQYGDRHSETVSARIARMSVACADALLEALAAEGEEG